MEATLNLTVQEIAGAKVRQVNRYRQIDRQIDGMIARQIDGHIARWIDSKIARLLGKLID